MAGFSGSSGVSKKYVDEAIAQSTATALVKRTTTRGTTGTTGNIAMPLVVIAAKANGYLCVPFMSGDSEGFIKVLDMNTLNPVANTTIDFVVYYHA